jgi:hypothetical protein
VRRATAENAQRGSVLAVLLLSTRGLCGLLSFHSFTIWKVVVESPPGTNCYGTNLRHAELIINCVAPNPCHSSIIKYI